MLCVSCIIKIIFNHSNLLGKTYIYCCHIICDQRHVFSNSRSVHPGMRNCINKPETVKRSSKQGNAELTSQNMQNDPMHLQYFFGPTSKFDTAAQQPGARNLKSARVVAGQARQEEVEKWHESSIWLSPCRGHFTSALASVLLASSPGQASVLREGSGDQEAWQCH